MQVSFVRQLRCPACGFAPLFLRTTRGTLATVHQGSLICEQCEKKYPVVGGILVMRPPQAHQAKPAPGEAPSQIRRSPRGDGVERLLQLPASVAEEYFPMIRLVRRFGVASGRLLLAGDAAAEQALGLIHHGAGQELTLVEDDLVRVRAGLARLAPTGLSVHGVVADPERLPFIAQAFDLVLSDGLINRLAAAELTQRLAEQIRVAEGLLASGALDRRSAAAKAPRGLGEHPVSQRWITQCLEEAGCRVEGWETRSAATAWVLRQQARWRGFPRLDRWPGAGRLGRGWGAVLARRASPSRDLL